MTGLNHSVEQFILKEIKDNKNLYIKFLQELIQTDSYKGNEKNVAHKIDDFLKIYKIKSEVFPFEENRANLIAYLNDNQNGKNLLYNGHMDVVSAENSKEWKYHPLSGYIESDGKFIYGRGSTDMKGGLTAMVISMSILKKLELSGNLILNAVADEETGGFLGTKECIKKHLKEIKVDFAVVGEFTSIQPIPKSIMIGEKGRLQLEIKAFGKDSHASVPFLGENAISTIVKIVENLHKLELPKKDPPISYDQLRENIQLSLSKKDFEEHKDIINNYIRSMTEFTKTITVIKGGSAKNKVPDCCELVIDIRLLPEQTDDMIINAFKNLLSELEISTDPSKDNHISYEINYNRASTFTDWENSETLSIFSKIFRKIYEQEPLFLMSPATTDAEFFRHDKKCPTIMFGPGDYNMAHKIDERLEIADFLNSIRVFTIFAYNFLKKQLKVKKSF